MRLLSAVYESARANIPLKLLPERRDVKAWDELDESVRTELLRLADKIQSVVRSDDQRLFNHRRVIAEFNRGLRDGFFGRSEARAESTLLSRGPYSWGLEIGVRVGRDRSADPDTIKQFVTATHLLAYEFGQLDQTRADPYDFILRNVGPQRADELGELAFALPVLINYRRELVQRILDDQSFSLVAYHATQSPQPSHLEYLTHGIVALFDASEDSWIRVAANMGLAARPFVDGTTLEAEHFQAPQQAADAVFRAPIAAHRVVRQQVDRVLLAREWLNESEHSIQLDSDDLSPVTLWDIYRSTPASRIRGRDFYFGDLVASNVIFLLSRYFESAVPPDQTGFEFLRRHFIAFTRGFDSRVEGVVDTRALASAARGRAMSEGLRRFEQGGPYIGQVSEDLQEVTAALNELHHALDQPVDFVLDQLEQNQETPLAAHLLDLFRNHTSLPRDLFRENADFELFSMTHVKTRSHYDLLRSGLYQVSRAVSPDVKSRGEASLLLSRGREVLQRIVEAQREKVAVSPRRGNAPGRTGPVFGATIADAGTGEKEEELVVTAQLLIDEFDTLVRIMRSLIVRLHHARALGKPHSLFRQSASLHEQFSGVV